MSNTNSSSHHPRVAQPAPNSTPEPVRRDSSFYSDHVVFQHTAKVEACLFKVPRHKFEQGSEVFRNMFAMPPTRGVAEGQSDDLPLVLESILADEFRSLLRVMFWPLYGSSVEEMLAPPLELDEWTHVLKLTTLWGFDRLRQASIDALRQLLEREDPVRWVALARKYEVREWLLPSLHALARREKALQVHEAEQLGISTAMKMAEVRESFSGRSRHNRSDVSRASHNYEPEILRFFGEEINPIGEKRIGSERHWE
ncbi:hypothetical protein GSI_14817 [Ganoderma sinense ZZ0214-1]|uniref:BTB domain-containing protein n=1 Tax=Ganoderma sinense ZZ0214-1 TaxID=1077348 RepID=A0A2G8RPQ7_9APHY|nr:hypothetical protein GSI_14817 [Ganoderma sinense ZZ0214-1]